MIRFLKTVSRFLAIGMANISYDRKLKYLRKKGITIGDKTRLNCSVAALEQNLI